jgi:hypothetical protein
MGLICAHTFDKSSLKIYFQVGGGGFWTPLVMMCVCVFVGSSVETSMTDTSRSIL